MILIVCVQESIQAQAPAMLMMLAQARAQQSPPSQQPSTLFFSSQMPLFGPPLFAHEPRDTPAASQPSRPALPTCASRRRDM